MALAALLVLTAFALAMPGAFAAVTAELVPTANGAYTRWDRQGSTRYMNVDDASCNGVTDYNFTTDVGERDSYRIPLGSIPDGATLRTITIVPCASRHSGTTTAPSSATMDVFYRLNGANSAYAGAYALSAGTTPTALPPTSMAISAIKTSTTAIEIGARYTSGNRGVRLSRLAAVIEYDTTPATPAAPAAPSGLSIRSQSLSAVQLGWTDNAGNETGFAVERSTNGGAWTQLSTAGANATAWADTVIQGNTYGYRVRALNGTTASAYSNVASTAASPPAAPASLAGARNATTPTTVALTWNDMAADELGQRIERSADGVAWASIGTVNAGVTTYTDAAATATATWRYRVLAYNLRGDSAASNVLTIAPGSASGPLTLAVTRSGTGTGTVSSAPAGISCGTTCNASFTGGSTVTLSAQPAAGSLFGGWGGACAGTGTCTVTLNAATTVSAIFNVSNASGKFTIGGRAVVSSATPVNVSASAGGAALHTQAKGALATVVAGPQTVNNVAYWNFNFDTGVDGWAAETGLSTSTTTPPATADASGPRTTALVASGPITAVSNQVISGLRISNPNGPCVVVNNATNVVIRDSEIGPCGGGSTDYGNANIKVDGGSSVTVEHSYLHSGTRAFIAHYTTRVVFRKNTVSGTWGGTGLQAGIEFDYVNGALVQGNTVSGSYPGDVFSLYQSSNVDLVDNRINVTVRDPSGAGFTMGDATGGADPGRYNYAAGNHVQQSGGVPAGVFGSSASTVLEYNCLAAGIQAYNYSGTFNGVTVRNNVINMGLSYAPVTAAVAGWSTNISGTNCALVPPRP